MKHLSRKNIVDDFQTIVIIADSDSEDECDGNTEESNSGWQQSGPVFTINTSWFNGT